MKCVIMAGGKGTRLWPLSRRDKPKQFQCLVSDKTMLQETFLRLRKKFAIEDIFISTNLEYVSEVEREILELPKENIIGEPQARGTASSMALVAAIIAAEDEDAIIAHFPADHLIKNPELLLEAVSKAEEFLKDNKDYIVTFGIKPTAPETGFGYIERDQTLAKFGEIEVQQVKKFVEKPDMMTAQRYIDSGDFYWNAGMYVWRVKAIIEKIQKYIPDTYNRLMLIKETVGKEKFLETVLEQYPEMENITIEYGVIENEIDVAVIPLDLQWSDVGSWSSLKDTLVEDTKSHFVKGEHIDFGSENLLVYGSKKLITTVGLKDLVIVDTEDAILICDRHKSSMISDVVKQLEGSGKISLL